MDKIKFRFPAFILLTFVLGSINASIVRAAESSSYRLETYRETADAVLGTSAGYRLRGSPDWSRRVLVGEHYQIVPDGGSGYPANVPEASIGASGGGGGVNNPVASRGDRAGSFTVDFGADRLALSAQRSSTDTLHDAPHQDDSAVQGVSTNQPVTRTVISPLRQKQSQPVAVLPFERSTIVETYTPITSIPCLSNDTSIGCMTIVEATLLSRLSFLFRAEQAISSIPAFQTMGRSVFTSSLMTMRAGSISLEGLLFPLALFRRRKKKSSKC
jgi:hypothetical protein